MAKRKSLFTKVGTYLVEILIIIIGITLSFALNEWKEKRSNHEAYYEYLLSLQQDIKVDSLQMATDIRLFKRISSGIDLILRYDDKYRKDSLFHFATAVDQMTTFIDFLPNNNTFQILSSTGGFNVFENKELVSEITQLYQFDFAFIKMMGSEIQNDRRNHLEPYMLKHIVLEDKETFPEIKTDIPRLIKDPLFRNICYNYGGSCWSTINSYRRAMKRLNKIDKMLKEELEGFKP